MNLIEAMKARHSVRDYEPRAIEEDVLAELRAEIDGCNAESGLNIRLVTDEPEAFSGLLAHYGKFRNVKNYIALVGKKCEDSEERAGYFGERIVLKAQQLGLNTCWVAVTFRKKKARRQIGKDDNLICVISLGYGKTQGVPHKNRPVADVCALRESCPEWFRRGVEAAMLAPTATNQQKFWIEQVGPDKVAVSTAGVCARLDLGIVKFHFEAGAGRENFKWTEK